MEVDDEEFETPTSSSSKGDKKRFEVKKVRAVFLDALAALLVSMRSPFCELRCTVYMGLDFTYPKNIIGIFSALMLEAAQRT